MSDERRTSGAADEPADAVITQLYREAGREAPPPQLDALVLAAARREAGARPRAVGEGGVSGESSSSRPQRVWRVPLALAAVIVLSVSILILSPERRQLSSPEPAATRPTPGEGHGDERPASRSDTPERSAQRLAPREALKRPDAAAPAPLMRQEERALRDGSPPPLAKSEAAEEGRRAFAEAPQRSESSAPRAAPLHADATAANVAELARQLSTEPAEKWGEKIIELRREGRPADADALLSEFRRRFPHSAVPPEWVR